ncbi:FAD-binding oxidoreductase [Ascidiimonas aurantiaca]|uniref:FAD-binding oxidoreductase n=1 Tax=Ascidiimonas aurantiaca TaxID=1685432 RepID=UPI0030EF2394
MAEITQNKELLIEALKKAVGERKVITEPSQMHTYSRDCTSDEEQVPDAVLLPSSAEEVSEIVKICNKTHTPVTVRGGGTGVSKGSLSYRGGIVLSTEKLNRIIEINTIDRLAVVECGVTTAHFQEALSEHRLCFPQNISSAASCTIGGNIAVSSGSPKSLKYGPTRNYLLNMEVVLPDGEIIWTGKNISKNATGYNLTQLIAGSEGSLGIITKVVLQLVSPVQEILIMVPFADINRLFECVHCFFKEGHSASSIEFIDKTGYELVSKFLDKKIQTAKPIDGVLWMEFEGKDRDALLEEVMQLGEMIARYTSEEIFVAQTAPEIKDLWLMRSRLGEAVINHTFFKDVDVVVPRSKIHKMYEVLAGVTARYSLKYTALGHIGNGNFHINIFQESNYSKEHWEVNIHKSVAEIFSKAVELGGTLSGEHGIGKAHLPFLPLVFSEYQLQLMNRIKTVFDKNNILN